MLLKLRVEISLDIEAVDFIEAASHQGALQTYVDVIRRDYPQVALSIKERRGPRLTPIKRPERHRRGGALQPYAERRREGP
jgi:hypothetical protein